MTNLKKFNVTVQCFNPKVGLESGRQFVLPVDSPDEEHAVSAAMSNAIAFTTKLDGVAIRPIAFSCTAVSERL